MEYLMTYGWAILVISIVLAALWQLGVFNSAAQAPRAQPGSYRVLRSKGIGGGVQTALVGTSSTNLLPLFVAQFDGTTSYISTRLNNFPSGSSPITFIAWIYMPTVGTAFGYPIFSYGNGAAHQTIVFVAANGYGGNLYIYDASGFYASTYCLPGKWHQVGFTYDGGTTVTVYCDGVVASPTPYGSVNPDHLSQQLNMLPGSSTSVIGAYLLGPLYYQDNMSNVQLYNTTLSASEVMALYNEGIGGAPLALPSLVGWWPLNGDAKDYSGNGNSGVPNNVVMSSNWASAYIAP
jgi:hypothetical protein